MKNAFFFFLNAFFALNGLIRKLRLISKLMKSQPGHQIITIHILPSISRSKEYQVIKFGELIKYVTNVFLGNSYSEVGK